MHYICNSSQLFWKYVFTVKALSLLLPINDVKALYEAVKPDIEWQNDLKSQILNTRKNLHQYCIKDMCTNDVPVICSYSNIVGHLWVDIVSVLLVNKELKLILYTGNT